MLIVRGHNYYDLPLEVDHPLKEFHADKELAPVDATYLESGVLHT